MQKSIVQFGFMASIAILISACQSPSNTQTFDKEHYLKQFIGQTSQSIRSRLDLKQIGYQTIQAPILKDNQLTYTLQRHISSVASKDHFAAIGAVPIPLQDETTRYIDANMTCIIQFQLKNNIAESVSYHGPAC